MKIRQIGNKVYPTGIKTILFVSNDYFLDADLLVIDMESIKTEFLSKFEYYSHGFSITETNLNNFIKIFEERKKQILTYLNNGSSLFIFNADFKIIEFDFIDYNTLYNDKFNLYSLFDLEDEFKTKSFTGSSVKIENLELKELLKTTPITYDFIFDSFLGDSLIKVKNTNQTIGVKFFHNGGNLFFLPNMRLLGEEIIHIHNYFSPKLLNGDKTILPNWCENYLLETESKEREELALLKNKALEINHKIELQSELLEKFNELKRLLVSTGTELELLVASILKDLGYEVEMPHNNRDDIIIKYKGLVAVLEIKGVKGSGAEKHAAQLMKWVNTFHAKNEIEPKGILIVNGFKDTPIEERLEKVFPDQMLPYCKRMEICLLTTQQLLEIIMLFRLGKINLEKIHKELFATIGEFDLDNLRKEAN